MKSVLPIILILAAFGLFFFFTNARYQHIKLLQSDIRSYDVALGKSEQVLKKRGELQAKYAQFATPDLSALEKLLPNHVDNVQLILDINGIARNHNMSISKIKIDQAPAASKDAPLGPSTKSYSSILVSFRTQATYANFVSFMKDLEEGLRLVDVTDLSFKIGDKAINDYSVTIKTYWLK